MYFDNYRAQEAADDDANRIQDIINDLNAEVAILRERLNQFVTFAELLLECNQDEFNATQLHPDDAKEAERLVALAKE